MKPVYSFDIYENTKVKFYRFKNINDMRFNVRPHDIYEHIAYNIKRITTVLNDNVGKGIKANVCVV
jgi:hypothetical protein